MNDEINTNGQDAAALDNGAAATSTPPAPAATATAPIVPPIGETPAKVVPATPSSVAERLSKSDAPAASAPAPTAAPVVKEPVVEQPAPVFDLSKLQPEQLIALKAALENAPLRVVKKGNPIIKLRRIDGKIVLDFGNAYQTLVRDEVANANVERVIIPVKFMTQTGGIDAEFTKVDYKDFMNADQIKCEVLSSRRDESGSYSEGEVESNERPGVMVELTVTVVREYFTVKLPEGSPVPTVEIEAKLANA